MKAQKIINKFPQNILTIFNLITEYGIKNYRIDVKNIDSVSEKEKIKFLTTVHQGFRLGQDAILKEMIPCLSIVKKLKERLKKQRRENNINEVSKTLKLIETIDYIILVYRHFADFIVWQVVQGKHSYIRAMYSGLKTRPSILDSNIESVISLIEYLHKKDPTCFALISDLTSFLDIGDVLLIKKDTFTLIEVKQGKKQKKVFEFIDFLSDANNKVEDYDYTGVNDKFFEQVNRTLKQFEKGINFETFIDSNPKMNSILENTERLPYFNDSNRYYDKFNELIETSLKEGFDLLVIEDIIYIGAFAKRSHKNIGFELMLDMTINHLKISTPIFKFVNIFNNPVVEPIFFKPIGKENIFRIILQQIEIFMFIDFDMLIKFFNSSGFEASWTSTKESHKQSEKELKTNRIFRFNNKSIKIKIKGEWIYLTKFSIHRLLFDNVLPSSFVN